MTMTAAVPGGKRARSARLENCERASERAPHFEGVRVLEIFELQKDVGEFTGADRRHSDVRLNSRANPAKFAKRHSVIRFQTLRRIPSTESDFAAQRPLRRQRSQEA